jgi:hypothetical protein
VYVGGENVYTVPLGISVTEEIALLAVTALAVATAAGVTLKNLPTAPDIPIEADNVLVPSKPS